MGKTWEFEHLPLGADPVMKYANLVILT